MKRALSALLCLGALMCLLGGCGEEEKTFDYSVDDIYDAVKEAYGDEFAPDGDMNEAEYTETYGLNMDDVEEIKGQIAMISFRPDRILVVKAKEGKGEAVEEALTAARENLIENGMWYPANLAKVNASQVVRHGDYVAYLMLGAENPELTPTEEEDKAFAEEQAKIGVDAFNALFE